MYEDYYKEVERRISARRSRFDIVKGVAERAAKAEQSDGYSSYGDSETETGNNSEALSSPDRWSDEEEAEEEYKPKC